MKKIRWTDWLAALAVVMALSAFAAAEDASPQLTEAASAG